MKFHTLKSPLECHTIAKIMTRESITSLHRSISCYRELCSVQLLSLFWSLYYITTTSITWLYPFPDELKVFLTIWTYYWYPDKYFSVSKSWYTFTHILLESPYLKNKQKYLHVYVSDCVLRFMHV